MELIDRHALLKNVYDNPPEKATMTHAEWCRKCIYEAPKVDAKPIRYGRWVYDETIGGMKHYYCTSCKERDPGNECFADENQILWFEFCPKCGADMRGCEE